jgi:hypothetical protein
MGFKECYGHEGGGDSITSRRSLTVSPTLLSCETVISVVTSIPPNELWLERFPCLTLIEYISKSLSMFWLNRSVCCLCERDAVMLRVLVRGFEVYRL